MFAEPWIYCVSNFKIIISSICCLDSWWISSLNENLIRAQFAAYSIMPCIYKRRYEKGITESFKVLKRNRGVTETYRIVTDLLCLFNAIQNRMHTKPLMQHQIKFYKTAIIYQRELEGLRKKKNDNKSQSTGTDNSRLVTILARWFKFNPS